MNTLSLTVRYRPIRIGWCVRADDFAALREALKHTFTMWGGHYNPVIPVDDLKLARSLVSLFRVDVLWPASEGEDIKKFIDGFPHLPNPFLHKELFISDRNGERSPQLVDIYHPIRRLYDECFKNNPSPNATVTIFEWQADDPLADVLLATFGTVPTGTDYLELLKQYLSAKTLALTSQESLPKLAENNLTVSTFCQVFMKQHYFVQNHWDNPGVYVGSANNFEDLVTFWNLRATNTSLMFYDPNHATRFEPKLTNWLNILKARLKGRFNSDNAIAIWYKEGTSKPDVSIFGDGICTYTSRDGTWNGLNIKAPYMYFSEAPVLAAISEDSGGSSHVLFQLPQKPFYEDIRLYDQHIVISVDHGIGLFGNERETFHTLYVPELNDYYGRECYFEWDKARVEPESLGIISNANMSYLSLKTLNTVELVKQIFSVAGIDAEPSKAGLIATRLIQQMGRLQGCNVFKIAGVRKLLDTFGPDTPFKHVDAMREIGKGDPKKGIHPICEYKDLFIEPREEVELKPNDVFNYLLKKGVFRTGMEFGCPSCRLPFWISLDDVSTEVACVYCGHKFNITPYLHGKNVWKYRRSGLFGRNDHQEGSIPVVLTLQQLRWTSLFHEMIYTTAMNLKPKSANTIQFKNDKGETDRCEIDFVVIVPRSIDGKIDIAIGECKTRKEITDNDVYNLKAVADSFPRDRFNIFVVFSKLIPFSQDEIKIIKQLNNDRHRRVILLTDRELEPYLPYKRTAKEFKINNYVVSFENMVNVTEQVFLTIPKKSKNQK